MKLRPSAQSNKRKSITPPPKINGRRGSYLEIGNWRLEEDSEGNLVAINLETFEHVIIVERNTEEE